jgi:ATP-binding cassette subfamily F protein uup
VLDEPTNDLDVETLELLESRLNEFPGTLLLVSHDRTFIDNVVTSTLVFEGDGRVQEYVGGYEDWARTARAAVAPAPKAAVRAIAPPADKPAMSAKLTYREQQELKQLPERIETLETEQRDLAARVAGADFYKESADAIAAALARLSALEAEILQTYARWSALEGRPS